MYNPDPICWCHQPQGKGVLLEVGPGEWRRFSPADLLSDTERNEKLRAEDFAELMGVA